MIVSHNNQKKIAVINDFSGFGRCSIAVSLPIISAMKIQCCPVPTSIFSNHTGFDSYFFEDYTDKMRPYIAEWRKLDLHFNGICTGFLGSEAQIGIVGDFLQEFGGEGTIVLIDPVMGDYGKLYSPYKEKWRVAEIEQMAEVLSRMGPGKVVITGIPQGSFVANLCYEKEKECKVLRTHRIGTSRSGTGDIFSAILAADAVNGVSFEESVKKASGFIKKCILSSIEREIPLTDGVCFEEHLGSLAR